MRIKLEDDWATVCWKKLWHSVIMLSGFHRIPERHGRTDGRTDRQICLSISCVSMLTRDNNTLFNKSSQRCPWPMWRHGFSTYNPALICPRLIDERSCDGSAFQTAVLWLHATWKRRAVFLSKGQACHGVLPNEDLPNQKCRDADVVEVGRTVLTDTIKRRILNRIRCDTGSQWSTSRRADVMCSYLPTPTTKPAAAFRTIWGRRMTCEET